MTDLYDLPDGWEWKTLGDKFVCDLVMGQSPKSDSYNSDGNGIAFFQGKKEFGDTYPTVEQYTTEPKKIAEVGDILLSVRAPVGPTNIANIQCCIGRGLGAIRPNTSNTLTNYLLYFFRNFELEISNKGKGSTFSAITKKELEETDIPLPPLSEQQRIVSKLDKLFEKIDKAIALHQKNMDEADVFMGSVLNDVFGELEEKFEKQTVEELCTKITDGTHSTPKYTDEGVHFLSVKDISKGIIDFSNTKYVSEEEHLTLSKRCNVEKDDVLYTKVGTTGIAKVVDTDIEFSIFVSVALLKPKKDLISSMFFQYILNSPNCYQQSQSRTRGMANRNLVLKDIKQINFPLPPLPIQQKVVAYLDEITHKIEKVKSIQKEKMDSLTALKASILDKAFRGEL